MCGLVGGTRAFGKAPALVSRHGLENAVSISPCSLSQDRFSSLLDDKNLPTISVVP